MSKKISHKNNHNHFIHEALHSPLRIVVYAYKKFPYAITTMLIFILCASIISFSLPYVYKFLTDEIMAAGDRLSLVTVTLPLCILFVAMITYEFLYRTAHLIEWYFASRLSRILAEDLYLHILKRPASYFENVASGEISRRLSQINSSVMYFFDIFPWMIAWIFFAFVVSSYMLFDTHWILGLIMMLYLSVNSIITAFLLKKMSKASEKYSEAEAQRDGISIDAFTNMHIVYAYGGLPKEQYEYSSSSNSVYTADLEVRKLYWFDRFQQGVSGVFVTIAIIGTASYLTVIEVISIGGLVLSIAVLPSLMAAAWSLGDTLSNIVKNYSSLKNALEYVRENAKHIVGGDQHPSMVESHEIVFDKVSFTYPNTEKPVFNYFSLHIKSGEKVGIVGLSGTGKSTLIKLLLRQHSHNSGHILIGNTNIENIDIDHFHELLSYVPQDTNLFNRSLYDNIAYVGRNVSEQEVYSAVDKAYLKDFIQEMPQGYNTIVGERGVKLSGGQRQRISIARALLKNAPILILDEATSALDSASEINIQQALLGIFEHKTVVAIAHRLSTLSAMDRIIVIDGGKVVENGKPKELLKNNNSIFKKLWEHQKNGFLE